MSSEIERDYYSREIAQQPLLRLRFELRPLLIKAKSIKRFTGNDLPKGIVVDDVYSHTMRVYYMANQLPLDESTKDPLLNMSLQHDLPEVFNALLAGRLSDVTAPQKERDPDLEEAIAAEELAQARNIFNDYELGLYVDFEMADRYLKGKLEDYGVLTSSGMICRLLDRVDAHLTLHRQLSEWAQSGLYDMDELIPDMSLTFAFRELGEVTRKVEESSLEPNITELCLDVINSQAELIKSFWNKAVAYGVIVPTELAHYLEFT